MHESPFQFCPLGHPQVKVAGYQTWLAEHLIQASPFQFPSAQTQVNFEALQTWVSGQMMHEAPFQFPAGQVH